MDEEPTWNEKHYMEVDVALLHIDGAARRIDEGIEVLRRDGGEEHLVDALEQAREELMDTRRRLMQGTLFAVPRAQLTLQ